MHVINRATARHYSWGEGCDGRHLLEGVDLSVIEECMPPGTSEQRHRHAVARRFFYVLHGEAQLELDDVIHAIGAGCGLHVPPGATHQMRNVDAQAVRFRVISSPPGHGDRVPATSCNERGAR